MANNNEVLSSKIKLFKAPTAYLSAYQQPTGSRFGADAIFNGDNKEYGAGAIFFIVSIKYGIRSKSTPCRLLIG